MTTLQPDTAHQRLIHALQAHGSRRERPGSWTCPAHQDHNASLSITQDTDRVLVHCHAGCTIDAITSALGLSKADLFDDQPEAHGRRNGASIVDTYPYTDEAGVLLFEVCRLAPKSFRQRAPDGEGGWTWSTRGVRRVPYRLPQVIAAAQAGATIHIVEGEKDVAAIEKAGGVATTSPGGAGKWRTDYNPHFTGAHVIIVADNDQTGLDHAETVRSNLTGVAASIRMVRAASGKDAADHLAEGHDLQAFVPIPGDATTATTTWAPAPDLLALAATPPEAPAILHATPGGALLYDGKRHLLAGEPETLKTWIAAAATTEVIMGGRGVLWWDSDGMGPAALVERLQALGATPQAISRHVHYLTPEAPLDLAGRTTLLDLITRDNIRLAVIDAFDPALELHGMSHKDGDEVQRFYRTIVDVFHTQGVATLLLDHVTKDRENRGRWSIGSQRKLAGCDVSFNIELHGEPMTRRNPRATIIINGGKDRPGWHHRTEGRRVGQWAINLDNHDQPWELTLGRPTAEHAADGGFRPTFLMERVSRWLQLQATGATKNQIETEVRGKREHIRRALDCLTGEGHAHVVTAARGAQIYRHITLYTETTDPRITSENTGGEVGGEVGARSEHHPGATSPRPHLAPPPRPAKPLQNTTTRDLAPTSPRPRPTTPGQTDDLAPGGGLLRSSRPPGRGPDPAQGDPNTDPHDDPNWRQLLPPNHPEATP